MGCHFCRIFFRESEPELDLRFELNTENLLKSDSKGYTMLHYSVMNNQEHTTKNIINLVHEEFPNNFYEFLNRKSKEGLNALKYAEKNKNYNIIKLLMETGAYSIIKFINDFERINKPFVLKNFYLNKDKNYKLKDEEGYTPLHWACFLNDIEAVNFLLEKADIDINCKSNKGFTPLHKAVLGNNPNIVIMLLKKGADVVSVNDKNESALDLVKIINEKNNRNKDILEKYKRIKSECNNQNKKQMNLNIDYPDKTKERNKENNLNFNQLNNVNNKNNNLVIENEPDEKKLIIGENKTNNKSKNNILYNPKNVNEEIIIKDNICQIKEENKEIIKKEENTKSIENTKNIKKEKIQKIIKKIIKK